MDTFLRFCIGFSVGLIAASVVIAMAAAIVLL